MFKYLKHFIINKKLIKPKEVFMVVLFMNKEYECNFLDERLEDIAKKQLKDFRVLIKSGRTSKMVKVKDLEFKTPL